MSVSTHSQEWSLLIQRWFYLLTLFHMLFLSLSQSHTHAHKYTEARIRLFYHHLHRFLQLFSPATRQRKRRSHKRTIRRSTARFGKTRTKMVTRKRLPMSFSKDVLAQSWKGLSSTACVSVQNWKQSRLHMSPETKWMVDEIKCMFIAIDRVGERWSWSCRSASSYGETFQTSFWSDDNADLESHIWRPLRWRRHDPTRQCRLRISQLEASSQISRFKILDVLLTSFVLCCATISSEFLFRDLTFSDFLVCSGKWLTILSVIWSRAYVGTYLTVYSGSQSTVCSRTYRMVSLELKCWVNMRPIELKALASMLETTLDAFIF